MYLVRFTHKDKAIGSDFYVRVDADSRAEAIDKAADKTLADPSKITSYTVSVQS